MRNKYFIINNFYVKADFKSFLLYLDYFDIQGYILTNNSNNPFLRKIQYSLIRIIRILFYLFKFSKIRYKQIELSDDALVIFRGKGEWTNNVKLINSNGQLKIIKKVFNHEVYEREKEFYEKYKNSNSSIKLPKHVFLERNVIEIEFIKAKSFQRLIVDGTLGFNDAITYFKKIKNELHRLYVNESTLIHGDFWLTNIFIKNNVYYFIDYSDSTKYNLAYDLYVLLFSILSTFGIIKLNEKTVRDISIENQSISTLIGSTGEKLKEIEQKFISYRKRRFGNELY